MQIMKYKLNLNVNFTFIRIYRDIFFFITKFLKKLLYVKRRKNKNDVAYENLMIGISDSFHSALPPRAQNTLRVSTKDSACKTNWKD